MPDIVQKFTIAADGAIKAIKSVADGLGDYNERVKDGTKVQKAYNERSQQTKDLLRELNSALRAVAPDIERMNEHVDVASRRFRSLATAAVNSKAEFIELQGAAREVRSKFGAVSDAALKLQTDLQNTAAAGRGSRG
jgi:chromosome segregation ATPase